MVGNESHQLSISDWNLDSWLLSKSFNSDHLKVLAKWHSIELPIQKQNYWFIDSDELN